MPKATSVIGTLWGDEGKGKVVDYLAPDYDVVVRSNGSANCGHTVRGGHIFHSISSGSLHGKPTYFGPEFLLNPVSLIKEYRKYKVPLICHPDVKMVSPLDVAVNRIRRYGATTGMGVYEAFIRRPELSILNDPSGAFGDNYNLYSDMLDYDFAREAWSRFVEDWRSLPISIVGFSYLKDKNVLFEGNQGLCLDQASKDFPYVTPAHTGSTDHKVFNHDHDIYYVSRCYSTRHGEGPFVTEADWGLIDKTNQPNLYQGTLRYGPLDIDRIKANIIKDNPGRPMTFVLNHCDESAKVGVNALDIMGELGYSNYLLGWSPLPEFQKITI